MWLNGPLRFRGLIRKREIYLFCAYGPHIASAGVRVDDSPYMLLCAAVNKPLVFSGGRHAPPVTGFTVRMIVDRYPVVSEVTIHDDATLHGKQPEDDGRRICGLIRDDS